MIKMRSFLIAVLLSLLLTAAQCQQPPEPPESPIGTPMATIAH